MQSVQALIEPEDRNSLQHFETVEADNLNPKQQTAIFALLTEPTLEAAAKIVGVQRTTLWRWLQDERFHHAYQQARRESVKQTFARLQKVSSAAVDCLLEVMQQQTAQQAPELRQLKQ